MVLRLLLRWVGGVGRVGRLGGGLRGGGTIWESWARVGEGRFGMTEGEQAI